MKIKVHFDLETGDPDDIMTLALLCTHPRVHLVGVSVFPGDREQVWLVRRVLERLGREKDVWVGADCLKEPARRVSPFYTRWLGLGSVGKSDADAKATSVLANSAKLGAHLLTGAALTNILHAKQFWETTEGYPAQMFESWTCQGGFAGDNVVPPEDRLEKFNGKLTCPTYNLNGNPEAAVELLGSKVLAPIRMVSKNVCHGFTCSSSQSFDLVVSLGSEGKHDGLLLLDEGVSLYEKEKGLPKALHDTLAAILMLSPELGTWVRGKPYRERGQWGFLPGEGDVEILTKVDVKGAWQAFVT